MSCNRCAAASDAVAPVVGAGDVEAEWAGNREHPQFCGKCHAFLRSDGGCTRCDGATAVPSDAGTLAMATPPSGPPAAKSLSCGHKLRLSADPGEEVWCTDCDDWATVAEPEPVAATPVASGADPSLPQTEYGRAAHATQHDRSKRNSAQAKVKDIGYSRVAMALRGVGVPATPTPAGERIRNMVWQYLDRCTCGAWISPRSPVCNNPRCGQKGKTMGVTRPWPPADVSWVQNKDDVGFELATPLPPKLPAAAKSKISSGSPPPPRRDVAADTEVEYEARVAELAKKEYGLEINDLGNIDMSEQIASGETPEELVTRLAEKYDLTPLSSLSGDESDGRVLTVDDSEKFVEDVDAELARRGLPELSNEEAEDWRKVVKWASSRGESVDLGEAADMIDRLRRVRTPAEDEGAGDEPPAGTYHQSLNNPDVNAVQTAWKTQVAQYEKEFGKRPEKFRLTFSEPVKIPINRRRDRVADHAEVTLFEARPGKLCYTFYSATGYELDTIQNTDGGSAVGKITSIEVITPQETAKASEQKVQKLGASVHPNAWLVYRDEMRTTPAKFADYGLNRVSMRRVFGDDVVTQLEDAFANGTDYSHRLSGEKRDRSVDVRRQADGSVAAWYSSFHTGSVSGDSYLLLNPYTASFKETD